MVIPRPSGVSFNEMARLAGLDLPSFVPEMPLFGTGDFGMGDFGFGNFGLGLNNFFRGFDGNWFGAEPLGYKRFSPSFDQLNIGNLLDAAFPKIPSPPVGVSPIIQPPISNTAVVKQPSIEPKPTEPKKDGGTKEKVVIKEDKIDEKDSKGKQKIKKPDKSKIETQVSLPADSKDKKDLEPKKAEPPAYIQRKKFESKIGSLATAKPPPNIKKKTTGPGDKKLEEFKKALGDVTKKYPSIFDDSGKSTPTGQKMTIGGTTFVGQTGFKVNTGEEHYYVDASMGDGIKAISQFTKEGDKEEFWIYVRDKDGKERWHECGNTQSGVRVEVDRKLADTMLVMKDTDQLWFHQHPIPSEDSMKGPFYPPSEQDLVSAIVNASRADGSKVAFCVVDPLGVYTFRFEDSFLKGVSGELASSIFASGSEKKKVEKKNGEDVEYVEKVLKDGNKPLKDSKGNNIVVRVPKDWSDNVIQKIVQYSKMVWKYELTSANPERLVDSVIIPGISFKFDYFDLRLKTLVDEYQEVKDNVDASGQSLAGEGEWQKIHQLLVPLEEEVKKGEKRYGIIVDLIKSEITRHLNQFANAKS